MPTYSAEVPPYITTPETVETRIGTLKFFDGLPDAETVQKVYDNLDFARGVEAFLSGIPAASVYAGCEGVSQAGVKRNEGIGVFEDLMDARSLFLTGNSTTIYVLLCLDLKDGPVVVEVPPGVLGPVDDAFFRWVTDLGLTGPDKGEGGRYLFVPPGYVGDPPSDGYFVVKPPTYSNLIFYRAFVRDGDIAAAVKGVKAKAASIRFRSPATRRRKPLSISRESGSIRSTPTRFISTKRSMRSSNTSRAMLLTRKSWGCSPR
jgi:hypothetical protein